MTGEAPHAWQALRARKAPRTQAAPRAREGGFSLIAAIFLIVVLAALGMFAVRISATQQQTTNFAILEARAAAAAQAGIEFGANRALATPSSCVGSSTLNLSEAALTGFTVKVTCTPHTALPYHSYVLGSTATKGVYGKPDFVSRTATRTVTDAP